MSTMVLVKKSCNFTTQHFISRKAMKSLKQPAMVEVLIPIKFRNSLDGDFLLLKYELIYTLSTMVWFCFR